MGYVVGWLWLLLILNGAAGTLARHDPLGIIAAIGAYLLWTATAFVRVSSKGEIVPFWAAVRFGLAWPLVLWPGNGSKRLHRRLTFGAES